MSNLGTKPLYYRYWGKTGTPESGQPNYHLLPYHCLDVAAVGQKLLEYHTPYRQTLSKLVGLCEEELISWIVFFHSLHDIGKFAVSFQQLRPDLLLQLQQRQTGKQYTERHDTLGYAVWKSSLKQQLQRLGVIPKPSNQRSLQAVDYWIMAVTGHHGQPPKLGKLIITDHFEEKDLSAVQAYIEDLSQFFPGMANGFPNASTERIKQASWWLAGFAVLCDWLGSNVDFFPPSGVQQSLDDYWETALFRAEDAIQQTELLPATPSNTLSLQQIIPAAISLQSTPLQMESVTLPLGKGPQLFILEDVTGAGKTEAALLLAHRLMTANLAKGIYFALPTMATANAMYERLGDVYSKFYTDQTTPSLVLAHGARDLSLRFRQSILPKTEPVEENYDRSSKEGLPPAATHCSQWLADSRKKALLAELGVGTIDQALLGVLPVRHQSLRLLGLLNKALLVDEVHACDAYMQPLLCRLLETHAASGGSAILLSATLPLKQRQALMAAFANGLRQPIPLLKRKDAYPLLTHFDGQTAEEHPIATRSSVQREVKVDFVDTLGAVEQLLVSAVNNNQCACWIRNTVADAREAFILLKEQHPDWNIELFHARFALSDRLDIERRVLKNFGKTSTYAQRRASILIATQVVEQSLDLDFDHLVTDLAPIDLIIQRAGRLHRHDRDALGNLVDGAEQRDRPVLTIHAPSWSEEPTADWFKSSFPRAQKVYDNHSQLWLTMKLLRKQEGGFHMPEDARYLIEGVYGDLFDIPDGLIENEGEAYAEYRAKASIAWLNALNISTGYSREDAHNWGDDSKTPTRLGEETTTVWLARWDNRQLLPWSKEKEFAWQKSSLSIRSALISQALPADSVSQSEIEACTEGLPGKGKWGLLLPMSQQSGAWSGAALDQRSSKTTFYYKPEHGLITEKEWQEMEIFNK